ncbi:MAG: aldose 1-epimerase [Chloroflexi bacterium]|nr:aldose 1-epimerase [Chloroflexota bacterium]OJW06117.1 MAG: hypothetical protein BGO39_15995 [Chloroflexi bacterium 54-19]
MAACKITQTGPELNGLTLENDLLKITVLPDKGADIYEFIYKPRNLDFLWKFDRGLHSPNKGINYAPDSHVAWMDYYEGGWQELFPSGGGPTKYKGVEIGFHGELSTLPWRYEILQESGEEVSVKLTARTTRTPFKMEKTLTLKDGDVRLYIREKLTNESNEVMDYSWGHHPAFGAPFLAEGLMIDVPATWVESKERQGPSSRLPKGGRYDWPNVITDGQTIDLSVLPPESQTSAGLAFLGGLEEGWYGLTNPDLGIGFGLVWPREIFQYLWLWQEFRGGKGWPWYSSTYVMGFEPFTSIDDSGLASCVERGTARQIGPHESLEVELIALCFESSKGVSRIDKDGNVTLKD